MNILFVSSGNSKTGITSLIRNQAQSLIDQGVNIDFFAVNKPGILGYFKSIKPLRIQLKKKNYDLIHAHYSFSGIMSSLSMPQIPVVVSLMGSDVNDNLTFKLSARFFAKYIWKKTIVKSEDLKKNLKVDKAIIIPNGVNISRFLPMDKKKCQENLGWNNGKKHLLFAADPGRKDKNFPLTKRALKLLDDTFFELHFLNNIPNENIPLIMNASDVVMLSSPFEGSPNVIKEAMACNCPIVSTDVGDVREVLGKTEGCYIANFDDNSFADGIMKALAFGKRTTGRGDIQHLDSIVIAKKIITLYKDVLVN